MLTVTVYEYVNIGDQLESLNIRRQRAANALEMMEFFDIFMGNEEDSAKLQGWLDDPIEIYNVYIPSAHVDITAF